MDSHSNTTLYASLCCLVLSLRPCQSIVLFCLWKGFHFVGHMGPGEPARIFSDAITDGKLDWKKMASETDYIFDLQISKHSFFIAGYFLLFFFRSLFSFFFLIPFFFSFSSPLCSWWLANPLAFSFSFLVSSINSFLDIPVPSQETAPSVAPLSPSAAACAASALAHSQWASSPSSLPRPQHLPSGAVVYRLTDSLPDFYACLCSWFPEEREALYAYFNAVREAPMLGGLGMMLSWANNVCTPSALHFLLCSSCNNHTKRKGFSHRHKSALTSYAGELQSFFVPSLLVFCFLFCYSTCLPLGLAFMVAFLTSFAQTSFQKMEGCGQSITRRRVHVLWH